VLTSTLQRTIQTASCLPFTQQRLRELDEINAGVCEHMTYEQVAHTYPHIHEARASDKLGYRCGFAGGAGGWWQKRSWRCFLGSAAAHQ
jgi:broad specificity phosphatase PhoE